MTATTQIRCPDCKAELAVDPHWPIWCQQCDWGLDPGKQEHNYDGRISRWWQRRLNRASEKEHQELLAKGLNAPPAADWVLVLVAAIVVHLSTVALVVAAVLLALSDWLLGLRLVLIALLLGVAWVVRPRPPRHRPAGVVLSRDNAPALHGLLGELSERLQVRAPDTIVVDGRVNASWGVNGIRGERVMTLGLPLWAVLDAPGKVALLGHELGHEVGKDVRRSWLVSGAVTSLTEWRYLLTPQKSRAARYGRGSRRRAVAVNNLGEAFVIFLMAPVSLLLGSCALALFTLSRRSGHRAEHRADRIGAELAGTAGAVELERRLLAPEMIDFALHAALVRDREADVWAVARDHVASVPPSEQVRVLRLSERTLQSVDASHPPTTRRLDLLQAGTPLPAAFALDLNTEKAVDAEIRRAQGWVRDRLLVRTGQG